MQSGRAKRQAQSSACKPPPGPPLWPLSPGRYRDLSLPGQDTKPPCPVVTIDNARARIERSSNASLAYLSFQEERFQPPVASPPDPRRRLILYYLLSTNNHKREHQTIQGPET